jgi:DNA-binding response OmpR family regulator
VNASDLTGKVVVVTAEGEEIRDYVMSLGADEYFTKPFSPTALLRTVEKVLADPAEPTASWANAVFDALGRLDGIFKLRSRGKLHPAGRQRARRDARSPPLRPSPSVADDLLERVRARALSEES